MPVKQLPRNAHIDHLKYQAKDLLTAVAARDPQVAQRIREFHPPFGKAADAEIFGARLLLSDAQFTIASEYGFPSWARLRKRTANTTMPTTRAGSKSGLRPNRRTSRIVDPALKTIRGMCCDFWVRLSSLPTIAPCGRWHAHLPQRLSTLMSKYRSKARTRKGVAAAVLLRPRRGACIQ
jgi:hypothetical protein